MSNIIKTCRTKIRLTQKQLADLLKVNQSYISQLENNKAIPSITLIFSLSKILKVPPLVIAIPIICNKCPHASSCTEYCFK